MSYTVLFKVKVEGVNVRIDTGYCSASISWDAREIIEASTGLPWINESVNGLCKDIIPKIENGLRDIYVNPDKYEVYASHNWGLLRATIRFFERILDAWNDLLREDPLLEYFALFCIE